MPETSKRFTSFEEFYPFYLSEHENRTCRRLHFIGTSLVVISSLYVLFTSRWSLLWLPPFFGYGFAWAGHFFFERNRPATFRHPIYSLRGDFKMFAQILTGKLTF